MACPWESKRYVIMLWRNINHNFTNTSQEICCYRQQGTERLWRYEQPLAANYEEDSSSKSSTTIHSRIQNQVSIIRSHKLNNEETKLQFQRRINKNVSEKDLNGNNLEDIWPHFKYPVALGTEDKKRAYGRRIHISLQKWRTRRASCWA